MSTAGDVCFFVFDLLTVFPFLIAQLFCVYSLWYRSLFRSHVLDTLCGGSIPPEIGGLMLALLACGSSCSLSVWRGLGFGPTVVVLP